MKKGFSVGIALSTLASLQPMSNLNAGTMGPIESAHNWSGFYIGGNLGGKWGNYSSPLILETLTVTGVVFGPSVQYYDVNSSSFTGGGQIGYLWQANHWVLGAEANLNGEQLNGSHILSPAEIATTSQFVPDDYYTTQNNAQAAILARLGYAANNWLLYGTAGVGFSDVTFNANFIPTFSGGINFPPTYSSQKHWLSVGTYGLGLEYAWTQNWRLGVEGRYTNYSRKQLNLGNVAVVGLGPNSFLYAPSTANLQVQTTEVLFKINYQFA
jgi:outer membrane immunogenic protein